MRCFIAIDLPNEIKEEIVKIQKQLPEAKQKLVEKENLHLTLVFLDEIDDYKINQIKNSLKEITFDKFQASLGKIGIFPSESFIRVVWVSMEPSQTIKQLHDEIFEKIKNIGKFDKRFESHITIARVKYIQDKENFIKKLKQISINPIKFSVNEFAIKKSSLTRQGPIYEDIIKFELK